MQYHHSMTGWLCYLLACLLIGVFFGALFMTAEYTFDHRYPGAKVTSICDDWSPQHTWTIQLQNSLCWGPNSIAWRHDSLVMWAVYETSDRAVAWISVIPELTVSARDELTAVLKD